MAKPRNQCKFTLNHARIMCSHIFQCQTDPHDSWFQLTLCTHIDTTESSQRYFALIASIFIYYFDVISANICIRVEVYPFPRVLYTLKELHAPLRVPQRLTSAQISACTPKTGGIFLVEARAQSQRLYQNSPHVGY